MCGYHCGVLRGELGSACVHTTRVPPGISGVLGCLRRHSQPPPVLLAAEGFACIALGVFFLLSLIPIKHRWRCCQLG